MQTEHTQKLHCLLEKGSKNFEQIKVCASFLCLLVLFHCDLDRNLSDKLFSTFYLLKLFRIQPLKTKHKKDAHMWLLGYVSFQGLNSEPPD